MKSSVLFTLSHSRPRTFKRFYSDVQKSNQTPFNSLDEYGILQSLLFPPKRVRIWDGSHRLVNDTTKEYTLPFIKQIKKLRLLEERRGKSKDDKSVHLRENILGDGISSNHANSLINKNILHSFSNKQLSSEMTSKIVTLINSRYLSKLDIDNFFKIYILSESNEADLFERYLLFMIENSNKTSFKPLMEYIENLWVNNNPTRTFAKNQLLLILQKACEVFPATEFVIEDGFLISKLGIEDVNEFKRLYDLYYRLFNVNTGERVLDDLLFQLISKCGNIELADEFLNNHFIQFHRLPSNESIDIFIKSLSKHILLQRELWEGSEREFSNKVKNDLIAYRELLMSDRISPAIIEFLLIWTVNLDEVYSVLEIARNSKYADSIFSTCQIEIIEAVVRGALNEKANDANEEVNDIGRDIVHDNSSSNPSTTNHPLPPITPIHELITPATDIPIHIKAMAHMFGTLNRFSKTSTGVTPSTLDKCLLLSAKYGNSAGMYKSLAMRLDLEENNSDSPPPPIHPTTLGKVFDCFPISEGKMNQEKKLCSSWIAKDALVSDPARDETILYHLRTMIDPESDKVLFQKYISALGRCGKSDRLHLEWTNYKPDNWCESREIILEIISAFNTSKSIDKGLQVVEAILLTSEKDSKYYTTAVSVLRDIFRYEILPTNQTLRFVADWFMDQKHCTTWSPGDIQSVFNEIGGPHSIAPVTPNEAKMASNIGKEVANTIIQVRDGIDVESSIHLLNQLLGKEIRI